MHKHKAACAVMISLASPSLGQTAHPETDQVIAQSKDFVAYMRADNNKSALCAGFEGKVVVPTTFDMLATQIGGVGEKREFETTAQYKLRQDAAKSRRSSKPSVVMVPLDTDYVRYDADIGAIKFFAGAFPTNAYSAEVQANLAASISVIQKYRDIKLEIPVSTSSKLVGTTAARNIVGAQVQVRDINRHTRALAVPGQKLFGFAASSTSLVMGYGIAPAQAARVKGGLKGALVIAPGEASVVTGSMNGARANAQRPEHFTELSTVIVTRPKCALILDPQMRVVASADTVDGSS